MRRAWLHLAHGMAAGVAWLPAFVALAGPAAPLAPAQVAACDATPVGYGAATLVCRVAGSSAHRMRFRMEFAGVHDDSQAAMRAVLDGRDMGCDAGAVARFVGEDQGNVLACVLAVPAAPTLASADARRLTIHLQWYHAEPVRFELSPQ